ncbi:MAG: DUF4105 domain-containing protein [Deltaproteobacteria bacterium]
MTIKLKDRPRVSYLTGAWPVFFLFLFLFPSSCFAVEDEVYIDSLLVKAKAEGLHNAPEWISLIHYEETRLGRWESLIDDKEFFLSKDGKTDPRSELDATIRALFSAETAVDLHPQCRYPARSRWLKRALSIDGSRLPSPVCKAYNDLVKGLDPRSVVLVFPVAYMNSPASMFGHTLLRIDSSYESSLFSYAVNYSAFTDESNGALFAVKGIFGFYEGRFSMLPYYEKIKEYSALESRDMWEYSLNLTKDEVEAVVAHMWELKDRFSYYYFFDENCAFNLLKALEAGRPGIKLVDRLSAWVIPLETIRSVQEAGLFSGRMVFRPSKATRIRSMEAAISDDKKETARLIAIGESDPASVASDGAIGTEDKIRTLDLAAEYIQYRFLKKEYGRQAYLESYLKVLGLRSDLGKGVDYEIPKPLPPEAGHGPMRLSIGAGAHHGSAFTSIGIRPANHGLMDPDEGYLQGAGISFFDTELRYDHSENKLSIQRLALVEINSIAQRSSFFKPVSWRLVAGLERNETARKEFRTDIGVRGGPGIAYGFGSDGLVYGFIEPDVRFADRLDKGYAAGIGLSLGVLKSLTPGWKAGVEARAVVFSIGDSYSTASVALKQRVTIDRSNAIMVDVKRLRFDGYWYTEYSAGWSRYF